MVSVFYAQCTINHYVSVEPWGYFQLQIYVSGKKLPPAHHIFCVKDICLTIPREHSGGCPSSHMSTVSTTYCAVTLHRRNTPLIPSPSVEKVLVLTSDGRTLTGTLLSCDQLTNLVLGQTIERVIRPHDDPEPSTEVSHGLYLIRGENVAVCGLMDEELDASIDWAQVRGNVVRGVKHV